MQMESAEQLVAPHRDSRDAVAEGRHREDGLSADPPILPNSTNTHVDLVRIFLADVSRYPLLSRREELELTEKRDLARSNFRRELLGSYLVVSQCVEKARSLLVTDSGHSSVLGIVHRSKKVKAEASNLLAFHLPTIEALFSRLETCTQQLCVGALPPSARRKLLLQSERLLGKIGCLLTDAGIADSALREASKLLRDRASEGLAQQTILDSSEASRAQKQEARTKLRQLLGELCEAPQQALARIGRADAFSNEATEAMQKLALGNMRLVISIAKKYEKYGAPLLDLVQMGAQGLMVACEKYDIARGCKFGTFAHWWIRQAISVDVVNDPRVIELPRNVAGDVAKLKRAEEFLEAASGRSPSDEELHTFLRGKLDTDYAVKDLGALRQYTQFAGSLDQALAEGKGSLARILPAKSDGDLDHSKDSMAHEELKMFIGKALSRLENIDPRVALVLRMRNGIETGEEMTLREIGEVLSISKERVRQLESRGLATVRDVIKYDPSLRRLAETMQEDYNE
jgi:RNA polymerase primary sigma factor